jgi:hypothetical protein
MTNTSRAVLRMSAAAALAATALSTAAYAEYRCATPGLLLLGEKQACELAKQATPDELVRFVHRTRGTYNLYVYDYVNDVDGARWEQAKHHAVPNTDAVAEGKSDVKKAPKFE